MPRTFVQPPVATFPLGHVRRPHRCTPSLLTAAAALACASPAHAQCPATFAAAFNYPGGTNCQSVAIGDFNGDGRSDLAAANFQSNNVSVLLGNGNGTFGATTNFPAGNQPRFVATGDFNGDGRLDLATANLSGNNVSVLLGSGNGTFGAPANFVAGTQPFSLAAGDINADGRLDLVVANFGSATLSVLLGNGNGTFAAGGTVFISGASPYAVALGDINADGRLDLVTASPIGLNAAVWVLLGNGNGTFGAPTNYIAGTSPSSVAIGDISGDGRPDIVVATAEGAAVLLGNTSPAGSFAPAVIYPAGITPVMASFGDLNGDGRPDLAVANLDSSNVSVLHGSGNGIFLPAVNYATPTFLRSVAIGDFNTDGRPDLVTASQGASQLSVLLGNGQQVRVTQQPVDRTVPEGQGTTFSVSAAAATSYRWRRNGNPLADGGRFSGVTTATLSIAGVAPADGGVYDVLMGSACNAGLASRPAMLSVQPPVPGIPNDNCSSPILIGNGTATFSTAGATTDGPTESQLPFCCGDSQINQDIWFLYTATATGTASINLCGSNYDTKIAVYNGTDCPSTPNTAIAGNDDSSVCFPGYQSYITFPCTAGNQYLIRVGGFSSSIGTAQLVLACTAAPVCHADFNNSGTVTVQDIFDFLASYFTGCP